MKRYSEMSPQELQAAIAALEKQMQAAEFPSQLAVLESKLLFARAYALSPTDFPPGLYAVKDREQPMRVDYLNGVMAWGTMDGEEISVPISALRPV
ncbi:DUF1811 family protein [Paenibacillus athensensis]|uniref:Uncharacterized protein n=1 Tax=Paenibacillus athensensis TaxID=1967502 RepID=A0A4Y8PTU3_9BACL|nr:DUF1811 family protein [Paenibacillus athensensis]MCD1258599.1 DUF1811 family protein [Paenibacillus athensensis]